MPKTRERKKSDLDILTNDLRGAKTVVFANYFGLKVKDVEDLRRKCRKEGVGCLVAKKTLLKFALKNIGLEPKRFEGEIMAIFGNDEVAPAKTSAEFAKTHEPLRVVAGIVSGRYAEAAEIKALSMLPSKEELLAKLVGSLNAPVSGFVNVLAGNLRGLVCVLNGIKEKK